MILYMSFAWKWYVPFPDKAPEVNKVVFDMMDEQKIDFKDGEYVLNEKFKDLIYSKDIIIKKTVPESLKAPLKIV